jgi:hypothetical protein
MVAWRKWGELWTGSSLALLCAAAVASPPATADQGRQRPQLASEIGALASDSPTAKWDTYSDTWVATDALNRKLPTHYEVGSPRNDRFVGLFFFLWHGAHVSTTWGGPYDISRILTHDREAMQKQNSPLWGPMNAPHHWGESLFGYYLSDDAYVLRKQAQMLADARVDTLIFDVSNQNTYKPYYMALLRVFSEVRQLGGATPQVAFLTPFWEPTKVVEELYRDVYEPGLYQDLWFRWVDKPLILADPILIGEAQVNDRQDTATHLDAGHTLGQTFTAKASFDAVGGRFPTFAARNSTLAMPRSSADFRARSSLTRRSDMHESSSDRSKTSGRSEATTRKSVPFPVSKTVTWENEPRIAESIERRCRGSRQYACTHCPKTPSGRSRDLTMPKNSCVNRFDATVIQGFEGSETMTS